MLIKEASLVYRALIKRNPDNFSYYKLLEISLGIKNNNKLRKLFYEKMNKFYHLSVTEDLHSSKLNSRFFWDIEQCEDKPM